MIGSLRGRAAAGWLGRVLAGGPALMLAGWLLAAPGAGWSQEPRGSSETARLAAVEAALDSGSVESARSWLQAWREGPGRRAGAAARSRATFLRARLSADPDSAEALYLEVALSGDSRYGDDAWLRLAQLHLARGEPERAAVELQRLRTDYPESDLLEEARRWSALADSAASAGGDPAGLGDRATGGERAAEPGAGPFAVQVGAFRDRAGAREVAEQARELGFQVRVAGPSPRDGLYRVRTPALETRGAAEERARRIRERGLPAIVVSSSPGGGR